jgi:hypothetical protein
MIVYISGSITNRPIEEASKHFSKAEEFLKEKGHSVVNPMVLKHDHDKTWLSYMKEDIVALMQCETIYMLKGWDLSRGAVIEFNLAKELGFKIMFE